MTAASYRALGHGRGARAAPWLRTARLAFWLGWQIESNWTDPLRFLIYAIVRPVGGALILVFMYLVVARADLGPVVWYFLVGSAFWPFVVAGMQGMAWGIIDDREHWRTLRYVYTAPIPYDAYLVGRSLAQTVAASPAMIVTLGIGRFALGMPITLTGIDWPLALTGAFLGLVSILALGLLLVTLAMSISGDAWRMPEGVGAALYLLCGVIFPVGVLPPAVQSISRAVPLTWWLEVMRRAVLGTTDVSSFTGLATGPLLVGLTVGTGLFALAAYAAFKRGLRRARAHGTLDRESAF